MTLRLECLRCEAESVSSRRGRTIRRPVTQRRKTQKKTDQVTLAGREIGRLEKPRLLGLALIHSALQGRRTIRDEGAGWLSRR